MNRPSAQTLAVVCGVSLVVRTLVDPGPSLVGALLVVAAVGMGLHLVAFERQRESAAVAQLRSDVNGLLTKIEAISISQSKDHDLLSRIDNRTRTPGSPR